MLVYVYQFYIFIYIFCRIGKHVGGFESIFLADLTGGELPVKDLYCGLEGNILERVTYSDLLR